MSTMRMAEQVVVLLPDGLAIGSPDELREHSDPRVQAFLAADRDDHQLPDADVVLYDSSEALYLDLQNGRVDVIMTNPMKAHLKFLSKPDGAGFEFKGPVVDEEKYFGIGVGIGLRQGQPELKERLNGALKQLINSGQLESYAKKIFPFKLHKDEWGQ